MKQPAKMQDVTRLESTIASGRRAGGDANRFLGFGSAPDLVKPPITRRFCGVEEFARMCGISRSHAYELVARREIPALRLGRRVLIPLSFLEDIDGGCDDEDA